ncbi:hypothetical protein LN457_06325 [Xanthomonas phaseoli]|uniref:hypothetical protein n=1 Tax=Xanthomonas phaseoli TaxID=1985254 RepID=UPI001E56644A|nr:hypothetical protein [Xanthomonas phaseoli]MCC8532430.1 hypothetical protein [Xanthomonas phaseoli]
MESMNSINLRSFAVALGKNKIFFGIAIISILGCAIGVAVADGGVKTIRLAVVAAILVRLCQLLQP